MSLTALACEIRDEAADQTIYASQLANGVITELSETLVAIGKALDEAEEGDAVGQAKKLIAKALILVR